MPPSQEAPARGASHLAQARKAGLQDWHRARSLMHGRGPISASSSNQAPASLSGIRLIDGEGSPIRRLDTYRDGAVVKLFYCALETALTAPDRGP
jgi:hypothetical protein